MKKINFLLLASFVLISCSGLSDAGKVLRNEKIRSTDEFLVKKRNPLVLPPDFNEIPEPGSMQGNKENEEEKIKKILKAPKNKNSTKNKSSTIEESILKSIRK
jgi:hypothetical protein|tara:strand:+ start:330 stop:638 length:309 start_codon:yes stop_codon:yes gene_type:complete